MTKRTVEIEAALQERVTPEVTILEGLPIEEQITKINAMAPDEVITLYHGTNSIQAEKILKDGFILQTPSFGVGVNTLSTTAHGYAAMSAQLKGGEPVVLKIQVKRSSITGELEPEIGGTQVAELLIRGQDKLTPESITKMGIKEAKKTGKAWPMLRGVSGRR